MKESLFQDLAKSIVHNCFRSCENLESIHAGVSPSTKTGDFSDVKVVTPFGEISWNQVGRISDEEMCQLNKEAVDRVYTYLRFLFAGDQPGNILQYPSRWSKATRNGIGRRFAPPCCMNWGITWDWMRETWRNAGWSE